MMAAPGPLVIGLGGNVGTEVEIRERFDRARSALGALGAVRSARLYRSAPVGPAQPWFLNTAVGLAEARAEPGELIAMLLEIERLLGRRRDAEVRWGPRPIDLDVLVWGTRTLRTPELEVPHPRLAERKFALLPLADLVGEDFVVPGIGRVGSLTRGVADQPCAKVADTW